jgi:hypothetical protein
MTETLSCPLSRRWAIARFQPGLLRGEAQMLWTPAALDQGKCQVITITLRGPEAISCLWPKALAPRHSPSLVLQGSSFLAGVSWGRGDSDESSPQQCPRDDLFSTAEVALTSGGT